MSAPVSFKALIDALKALPGIGPRAAQRIAFELVQHKRDAALGLAKALEGAIPDLAARQIIDQAIQMHGGIAITWESDIQFYFKRAHGSAQLLGSSREHLRRLESEVLA